MTRKSSSSRLGGKRKPEVQRRRVSIAISAPVCAFVIVKRSGPDGDWEIENIERVDCDLSARGVTEHATDDELAEMDRLANEAEDLP